MPFSNWLTIAVGRRRQAPVEAEAEGSLDEGLRVQVLAAAHALLELVDDRGGVAADGAQLVLQVALAP